MKFIIRNSINPFSKSVCRFFWIVFATMILCNNPSYSQEITSVIHLEEKDGLADRIIERVTRGDDGLFYLFGNQFIQTFDGVTFKDISKKFSSFNQDRNVDNIVELSDQIKIVIHNNDMKESFAIHKGKLKSMSPIYKELSDNKDISLSGNENKLYFLSKIGDTFSTKYKVVEAGRKLWQDTLILEEIPTKLFSTSDDSLFVSEKSTGEILWHNKNSIDPKISNGRLVYRQNNLILCNGTGIYKIENKGQTILHEFEHTELKCLWAKADKKGNILIALHENIAKITQLYLLDSEGNLSSYNDILPIVENIKDVYSEDFTRQLMAATYNGLYIMYFKNPAISTFFKQDNVAQSGFGNVISGICHSQSDEAIYFLRERSGLFKIENNKVKTIDISDTYTNNSTLTASKNGKYLYGIKYFISGIGGVNIYNIATHSTKSYSINFIPLFLHEFTDGRLLIGGGVTERNFIRDHGAGAAIIINPKNDVAENVILPTKVIKHQLKSFLHVPHLNQFWIGTTNGLFCLNESYEVIAEFSKITDNPNQLFRQDHIRELKYIDQNIYVGTRHDGLYIVDPNTWKIVHHLDENSGLTDNAIICIEEDDQGNVWLASFNGINVIEKKTLSIKRLYDQIGLTSPEFNTNASAKDTQGNVYFGSLNGISVISPKTYLQEEHKYFISIEKIIIFDRDSRQTYESLNDIVRIPARADSIQIHYRYPNYYTNYYENHSDILEKPKHDFKNIIMRDGFITIPTCTAGNYTLSLGGTNTNNTLELYFIVEKNYLPIVLTMLILLLALGIWYWVSWVKLRATNALESEKSRYNKKIAQLELTALRAQMNPHFIFNALGAVQYFINTHNVEKADDYLGKFAMLMRSILESSKSKFIKLEDEIKLLELYTGLEHIRFEEKFTYEFSIDPTIDKHDANVPSMIIQPFVENAINHGLYHLTERKGYLHISFNKLSETSIECIIDDNGIGRKASATINSTSKHKSRGMQIVDERINALKLYEAYDINILLEDKIGQETGTKIRIIINQK